MKKLLSVLLALAMLLSCCAFAEAIDYTGTWVLTGAEAGGVTMGPDTLALFGLETTVVFNADGTMTMSAMDVTETGTWEATETGVRMIDPEETIEAVYNDGVLSFEAAGSVMMLTREGAAPAIAEAAAVAALTAVAPEAFEGQWLLTSASVFGVELTAEDLGMYMAFVLQGGAGIYGTTDEAGELISLPVTYTLTESEAGTFIAIVVEDDPAPLMLYMADENTLYAEEEGVYMYFTRVVEEAAE